MPLKRMIRLTEMSLLAFSSVPSFSSRGCFPKSASSSSSSSSSSFSDRYWTALIKEVDQKLDDAVSVMYPERLHEAMRYSVLTKAAKRLPPLMSIAACELFGGNRAAAFPTACALEMAHLGTLIHDGVPFIDDSPSLRGQPSSHTIYGDDMALLAGSALTITGITGIISQTPPDLVPETRILRVILDIFRSIGCTRMSGARFRPLGPSPDAGDFVKEYKFGEICQCSAACGGVLGGASDDEIQRLRNYGRAVGVMYKVVQDILEAKTVTGKDQKKGRSYVTEYGVEKAVEVVEDLRFRAKKELEGFHKYGDKVLLCYDLVDFFIDGGFDCGK